MKELYIGSPENHKSLIIIETVITDSRPPLPLFVITPGKKIIENWIRSELTGKEEIDCSPIGYMNNEITMKYADHLIQNTRARPEKP